jgi:hypothetical protein
MKETIFAACLLSTIAAFAADDHLSNVRSQALPERSQPTQSVSIDRQQEEQSGADNSADDLCYTMRVYMFEARDGEAPQPKGVKTCVGASPRILKKAVEPQAHFKP